MQSELCEVEIVEETIPSVHIAHTTLRPVLQCTSAFYINVEKSANVIRENPLLLERAGEHFAVLDALIAHLEAKIFFSNDADELVFRLRRNQDSVKLLCDAYCCWETALEHIFSRRLCVGEVNSLNDYRLNARFQRLLKRETSMLRVKEPKRALFIGSGPFPISAIWLHRYLGIPVDGLDISSDAVERSRELVNKIGLSNEIKIIHEPSIQYDVSAYDVIIIALLAKPKQEILENIFASAKRDCDIICRTSNGLRRVIYEPTLVSPEILDRFSIEDARVVHGNVDDTISSMLLKMIR